MDKKKVLIVHNYYQTPGGEDTVVSNEKKLLEEHGHKVILYCRNNSELKKMSKSQKLMLPFITVFNIQTYMAIKRIIKEQHVDIVHVHNTLNLISPSVYYAAIKCKVPVIQTIHNFRLLCPGATFYRDGHICEECVNQGLGCAIKHSCYRNSRIQTLACVINTLFHRKTGVYRKINYICLTEFNKEKLLQLNCVGKEQIIIPEKVFVKPNFTFDLPTFRLNLEKKDNYLFMGRVEKIKGLDVLLKAFAAMPDKRLFIAGTGIELEYYKGMAEKLNLKNVSFVGFLNKTELIKYMDSTKAVIVPSQWYETFGMIIAEAYAAHIPVIVGDIGNIATLVDEYKTGIKFQYDSSESLVKVIRLFESTSDISWRQNAYLKFKKELSPEINYKILDKIYAKVSTRII